MHTARRWLLIAGVVAASASGVAAIATTQAAWATNETWSCYCHGPKNAPSNNWVSFVEVANYSGKGLWAGFWVYHPEKNEYVGPFKDGSSAVSYICWELEGHGGGTQIYGHGFVEAWYGYEYSLAGRQTNYYCPYA